MSRLVTKYVQIIREYLRQWLGIVYLDKHLSGRLRELEDWKNDCLVTCMVDKHYEGKDIIILAVRFGTEDRVKIIGVEFKNTVEFMDLAKRLENNFRPPKPIFWDGPPGFTEFMRNQRKRERNDH